MDEKRKQALKVAGLYVLFGSLWIAASDRLLLLATEDRELLLAISSIKGFLFVAVTACLLYLVLSLQKESEPTPNESPVAGQTGKSFLTLALVFAGLSLLIPLLGYGIFHLHGKQMEKEAQANLWTMAALKADRIESWLTERQANGEELAANLGFIERVERWLYHGNAEAEEERIHSRLAAQLTMHGYEQILLLDRDRQPAMVLGDGPEITPALENLLEQARDSGKTLRGELHQDPSGRILWEWAVPLFLADQNGVKRAVATVLLRAAPERALAPLFRENLARPSGGEIILVRRHNNALLPLDVQPLRQQTPCFTSPALGNILANAAENGIRPGTPLVMTGLDSAGTEVLAAVHPVAGSDLLLLAKTDRAGVLHHLTTMIFWVSLVVMAVMAAMTAVLFLFWRQQQHAHRLALLARTLEKDRLLRKFFELPFVGMAITSPENKRWLQFNDRLCEILGYPREELARLSWTDMTHPEDLAADVAEFDKVMQGRSEGYAMDKRFLRKDGQVVFARIDVRCVRHNNGAAHYFVATVEDITQRRQAEERLRLNAAAMGATRDAVLITDLAPKILAVNPAFAEITGYKEDEALGQNPRILNSGRHKRAFFQDMWANLLENGFWQGEIWNRRKNGETYPEWLSISTVRDEQGSPTHYVAVATDISRIKQSEERLHHLTHHDPLTGLPNRLLLEARLQHTLERAEREQGGVAVLNIDLDQFKTINDSLGYTVGDELLVAITGRLRDRLREEDTLARMMGDQFALVLETRHGDTAESLIMASRIMAALEAPFTLPDGYKAYVRASIGISVSPQDGDTAQLLLARAEAATHLAKERGRNQFCYYTDEINQAARTSLELEAALRRALDQEELLLYYQPKVDLRSGRIVGAEALLRWQRPGHGLVGPMQFIPAAEKCGLIEAIGSWVLESACQQIKAWREAELPEIRMAVNVSARQFRSNSLERTIRDLLAHYGVQPQQLILELTESMLMDDPDETVRRLTSLKSLGILLSLDDFGTGYSSLAYLNRFPIDQMKIDRSFVSNIVTDPAAATIATSIIGLAHRMSLEVVAEGVETEGQLGYLRQNSCDIMQGYLFSKAVPAEEFSAMLREGRTLALPDLFWEARTLLLVEDKADILADVQRILSGEGYRILTAGSAAEGLEVLARNPAQVVISEQRMPQMSGIEFLGRIKTLYPDAVCLIISGAADLDTVSKALSEGTPCKLLVKPWDDEQLREQVRYAFLQHARVAVRNR